VRKVLIGAVLLGITLASTGCASWSRFVKSWDSNLNDGLNRKMEVYSTTGQLLRTYEGTFDIKENESGSKVLFDLDGKRHIIYNATVIVDEK
jgi:hypothetical protein